MLGSAACYTYVPVDFTHPEQGWHIRAGMTPAGEREVVPRFGPGIREVRGLTLTNDAQGLSVLISGARPSGQHSSGRTARPHRTRARSGRVRATSVEGTQRPFRGGIATWRSAPVVGGTATIVITARLRHDHADIGLVQRALWSVRIQRGPPPA